MDGIVERTAEVLYLCKRLCDKMNVGIRLESEEGKGAEVILTLPKGTYTGEVAG